MTILRSTVAKFGIRTPAVRGTNAKLRSAARRSLWLAARLSGLALILVPLPGCQSITGATTVSQVRIIDTSPDSPGIDVYQGSAPLAYNLGVGTITSYVPIVPGGYSIIVDTAGSRQQLVTTSGTFLPNAQYTVLVGNYAATLQELILKDQSLPAPAGDIGIRVIDQSLRTGSVDVYLVPSGSTVANAKPILTDITFNSNSGYLDVPNGTYTLVVLPTGTVPTATTVSLYTGAAVTYAPGSVKTVVLIDTTVTNVPAILALTADDYSSPS